MQGKYGRGAGEWFCVQVLPTFRRESAIFSGRRVVDHASFSPGDKQEWWNHGYITPTAINK